MDLTKYGQRVRLLGTSTAMALLFAFLIGAAHSTAYAADNRGAFVAYGVGNDTCQRYVQARRLYQHDRYEQWLAGNLTSFNVWKVGVYDILEKTELSHAMAWLDQYCIQYPDRALVRAANAFVRNLLAMKSIKAE